MLRRTRAKVNDRSTYDLIAEKPHFLAPLAGEEVDAVDEPHPVAARAHQQRMRSRAVGEEADAAQQVSVRDAGRSDDHLARREILGPEDALVVEDPGLPQLVDLPAGGGPELRLQLAAQAGQRGGREYGLPGAADPDRQVVVRAADRRGDRRGHVAVLDELDAGAGGADLLDEVVVARPVEDQRRDVARGAAVGLGDGADVVAHRAAEVDLAARGRA